jgi:hypothetical protein
MDVKQAVTLAKGYFADLFASENYLDQGLEEINFDEATASWEITIGFRRPIPNDQFLGPVGKLMSSYALERSYKVVRISDTTGKVISVKNREIQLA